MPKKSDREDFRRLEKRLKESPESLSSIDSKLFLTELYTYQMELEMQDEELRRTQHDLEIALGKYFDLYHLAPSGYITIGNQGTIQEANLTAADMLGVDKNLMLNQPLSHFIFKEDRDIYSRKRNELFATGIPQKFDLRMLKCNKPFWVTLNTLLAVDNNERAGRITIIDISERKKSEQDFRMLTENSPDLITRFDTNCRHLYVNPAAAKAGALPAEEYIGKTIAEAGISGPDAEIIDKHIKKAIDSGETQETIHSFLTPEGKKFFHTRFVPEIYVDGSVQSVISIARDVTERLLSEEANKLDHNRLKSLIKLSRLQTDSIQEFADLALVEAVNLTSSKSGCIYRYKDSRFILQAVTKENPGENLYILGEVIKKAKPFINNNFRDHRQIRRIMTVPIFHEGHIKGVIELSDKPDNYDDGDSCQIAQFINSACDIIARRNTEMQLRISEERYRLLFENMLDGCAYCRLLYDGDKPVDFEIIHTNRVFDHLTGLKNLSGKLVSEVIPGIKESHPEAFEISRKVALSGKPERFDFFFKPMKLWLTISIYCTGKDYFTIILDDTTERKLTEEALRKSEAKYRLIIETANEGVWIVDQNSRTIFINSKMAKMLGYLQLEMLGKTTVELMGNQNNDLLLSLKDKSKDDESGGFDLKMKHKNGSDRWFHINASPMFNEEGIYTGFIGLLSDITKRKKSETELEMSRNNLARSNRDLEQFAYVTSHDLKEPLRAIHGFTAILKEEFHKSLDSKQKEYLHYIEEGTARMQALINGLLEYSRVDTRGKTPELTDSKTCLKCVLEYLESTIKETNAKVTSGSLPKICVDAFQLEQLFQNLISNAIKFHSDSSPLIHISASHKEGAWEFAVRDNGIGIDRKFKERIFQIFQRLHTREEYPGTGIGLAVCRKIVERHNGKIWVESNPKGSTFYFTIPDTGERGMSL